MGERWEVEVEGMRYVKLVDLLLNFRVEGITSYAGGDAEDLEVMRLL